MREARRRRWRGSICSGRLVSTAACGGGSVRLRSWRGAAMVSCNGGEKEGKEEQHVEGGLFTLHGGPGARRRQGTPRRHGGNGASVSRDATGGRDERWVPLSGIWHFFCFSRISIRVVAFNSGP